MMTGDVHKTDAEERVSERARFIALCTSALGLLINGFVCAIYAVSGEGSALVYGEVFVYAVILSVMTFCAVKRIRIKKTFTFGLLSIFAVFWVGTFIEGLTDQAAAFDFPLVLFEATVEIIMNDVV